MLLAQVTNEQVTVGAVGAAVIFLTKAVFEIISQWTETRERRRMKEELIRQTEVLREIHDQQKNTCRWNPK